MIPFILTAFALTMFATYDWHVLEVQKKYIYNHRFRFILRVVTVLLIYFALDCYVIALSWFNLLGMCLFFASSFDSILNCMRCKPFLYLGKTAKWDKFWGKHYVLYAWFIINTFISGVILMFL